MRLLGLIRQFCEHCFFHLYLSYSFFIIILTYEKHVYSVSSIACGLIPWRNLSKYFTMILACLEMSLGILSCASVNTLLQCLVLSCRNTRSAFKPSCQYRHDWQLHLRLIRSLLQRLIRTLGCSSMQDLTCTAGHLYATQYHYQASSVTLCCWCGTGGF